MELSSKISGDQALIASMGRLPKTLENRALRPGMRAGGNVIKVLAAANVKRVATKGYSKGLLARSIVVRAGRMRRGQLRVIVAVAPARFSGTGVRVGLYGSVLELGRIAGHGGNRSTQKPAPWLRPAAKTGAPKAYSVFVNISRKNLDAAVKEARL